MGTYNTRFITPPKEEEEIYPYRRVWRSIVIESGILTGVVGVIFVLFGLLNLSFPERFLTLANIALALLPAALWVIFSRLAEDGVPQPRQQLTTTFLFGALVAGAVGLPIVDNVIRPETWLPLESVINRVIGFSLTLGILQEGLKFAIVRYTVWSSQTRIRIDTAAYACAVAVGWATTANLQFALETPARLDAMAIRVLAISTSGLAASLFVAYGLAMTWTSERPSIVLLAGSLVAGALVVGLSSAVRASIGNATIGVGGAFDRPLFSLGFVVGIWVVSAGLAYFAFNVADNREALALGADR